MQINIITSNNFKTSNWSGGTTTQFFIYPLSSNYQKLDFDFRLSMATVSIEKSIFTALPDISRTLMVIDGQLTLHHKNKYSKHLKKFDSDQFEGGWETSSVGMCTDFNLMTSGNTNGELAAFEIKENKNIQYQIPEKKDWLFIYNYLGKVTLSINNETYILHQSDLLVMNKLTYATVDITAISNSVLIFSEIMQEK